MIKCKCGTMVQHRLLVEGVQEVICPKCKTIIVVDVLFSGKKN